MTVANFRENAAEAKFTGLFPANMEPTKVCVQYGAYYISYYFIIMRVHKDYIVMAVNGNELPVDYPVVVTPVPPFRKLVEVKVPNGTDGTGEVLALVIKDLPVFYKISTKMSALDRIQIQRLQSFTV